MARLTEFVRYLEDSLQLLGPVQAKRMFGGYGLFLDGLMFALVADGDLYFKVDEENRQDFEQLGLLPFSYRKRDKLCQLSYYHAPAELLEDLQLLVSWANKAYAAALRAAAKKQNKH